MTESLTATPSDQTRAALDEAAAWDLFISAKAADEFCRAWLALVCARIPKTKAAAVLIESADGQSFVPIAAWPAPSSDFSRLGPAVERAIKDARAVVQPADGEEGGTHLSYPVILESKVVAAIVVDTGCAQETLHDALRHIHWSSAWLSNLLSKRDLELASEGNQRISGVLESTAVALRSGKFQQVLFELANELRQRFSCSRVAIGLVEHAHIRMTAFSDAATFAKNTPLVKAYVRAMEEAYDHGRTVVARLHVTDDDEREPGSAPFLEHLDLLNQAGAEEAVSCLLIQGAHCVGIITLERSGERGFTEEDRSWLEAFAALFAPVVEQRRAAERSSVSRFVHECKTVLQKIFGPRHLVWKAAFSLIVTTVAVLSLVNTPYRVAAKTVIEGEIQRVAAAPFEGFIIASHVRAGDTVRKGQLLARLDDRDLKLEKERWASERDQFEKRLREAMSNHELSAIQVIGAQLKQAEAQLALVEEKILRSQIKAPFDGLVVSGDLSQQIGTPVESGKKLFEVAPLESYRVVLKVDEREIRNVKLEQQGQLMVAGILGDPLPFEIVKMTPVATAEEGKNFFRVEARLQGASPRLRPGMQGVGKIEVGERQLWWILTHGFTDWLRLALWEWSL